jgi:hypothetical protein
MCYKRAFENVTKYLLNLYFYINKNINKLKTHVIMNEKWYEVSFNHEQQIYKIRFPRKKGPCKLISAFTVGNIASEDFSKDITDEIMKFMGPCHNFYGINTSPSLLGYSKIKFVMMGGKIKEFNEDEIIIF